MGILMGIVSFILGFAVNLLDACIEAMLNAIGYDISTFLGVFPFAHNAMSTFTAMGLAFLILGLIWQAFKGLGAPFGIEYENPLHVVAKVALAWFAVVNLTSILNIITKLFQIVVDDMNNQSLIPGYSFATAAGGLLNNLVFGIIDTLTGGILSIVMIIFAIILGWKFVKLLIEMVERYIVYCFICLIGPVFVATAAFKSTKNISETWFRAFFGQSLLILLNTWSAKMFLSYLGQFMQNLNGIHVSGVGYIPTVVMMFFGFAFLNFASRIDSFLRILGLNTAHTGAGMAQGMLGGVTKMLMGARGLQSAAQTLGGAAAAAKGAGGLHTVAGRKAATSSIVNSAKTGFAGGGSNSSVAASTIGGISPSGGGVETNRRADGTKTDANAPGRRVPDMGVGASGNLLKQESTPGGQMMAGQNEIKSALSHQASPDSSNGIGGTNGIRGAANKADYVDGGVLASAGRQAEESMKNFGSNKPLGEVKQDAATQNAVRAAATGAEQIDGKPIASYQGQEAAAAMNGVLGFGNENLQSFNYAVDPEDGTSGISGMSFQDGSSVTFDSVAGGVASGVYTDADGNSTAFDMVHDNAIDSMQAASGGAGGIEFDKSASVGYVGDGSGDKGYHVVPRQASASDSTTTPYGHNKTYSEMGATVDRSNPAQVQQATTNLNQLVGNLNPVNKSVQTLENGKLEQMQKSASGATPKTRGQKKQRSNGEI